MAAFERLKGTAFVIGGQRLVLEDVSRGSRDPRLNCFSLRFRGSDDSLPERIHRCTHPDHPNLDLFISPGTAGNFHTTYRATICRFAPGHNAVTSRRAWLRLPVAQVCAWLVYLSVSLTSFGQTMPAVVLPTNLFSNEVVIGRTATYTLQTTPAGGVLTNTAPTSSNASVATATKLDDTNLRVSGLSLGTANITISAEVGGSTVTHTFPVTVRNPFVVTPVEGAARTVAVGGNVAVNISTLPSGGTVTTAAATDAAIAEARPSGKKLLLTGLAAGATTITYQTAIDSYTATNTLQLSVTAATAPSTQTIDFPNVANAPVGTRVALSATSNAVPSYLLSYAVVSGTGTLSGTSYIPETPGVHVLRAYHNGNETHRPAQRDATITAVSASITPTIVWEAGPPIMANTPLGAAQQSAVPLDAHGRIVPGTFAFTPTAGTTLSAGTSALSATFTPLAPATYSSANASATLTVFPSNPTLSLVGGNNQTAPAGQFNAHPFDVAVWNPAGTAPLVNAPVTFSVTQGGGMLAKSTSDAGSLSDTLTLRTDADGTAQAYFQHGTVPHAVNQIQVTAGTAQITFTSTTEGPPVIGNQPPASSSIESGESITFSVTATGLPPPTFQWQKNGVAIVGATNSSYMITNATAPNNGVYTVVITNALGAVTSMATTLAVNDPVQSAEVREDAFALFEANRPADAIIWIETQVGGASPVEKELLVAQQLTRLAFAFHNRNDSGHAELVAGLARARLAPHLTGTLCALHCTVASEQAIAVDLILGDAAGALARIDCALRYLDQMTTDVSALRAELQNRRTRLQQKLNFQQGL